MDYTETEEFKRYVEQEIRNAEERKKVRRVKSFNPNSEKSEFYVSPNYYFLKQDELTDKERRMLEYNPYYCLYDEEKDGYWFRYTDWKEAKRDYYRFLIKKEKELKDVVEEITGDRIYELFTFPHITKEKLDIFKSDPQRFIKLFCKANIITYRKDDLENPLVYIGERALDNNKVLFYLALNTKIGLADYQLKDLSFTENGKKKFVIIPKELEINPLKITDLVNNNIYVLNIDECEIDANLRMKYQALAEALKIKDYSLEELTKDGYNMVLDCRNHKVILFGNISFPPIGPFRTLWRLAETPGERVFREDLLEFAYDNKDSETSTWAFDKLVERLRKNLAPAIKGNTFGIESAHDLIKSQRNENTITLMMPPDKVLIINR